MALVAKRGTALPIYGNFLDDESGQPRDTTKVFCKICSCVMSSTKDGQTANLHDRVRKKYHSIEQDCERQWRLLQ